MILFSICTLDELGNMLGLAMSQALRLNVIVFTSLEHMPVVPISPLLPCLASKALLVGYNVAMMGQYYIIEVIQYSNEASSPNNINVDTGEDITIPKETHPGHCACGRGGAKKDGREFCKPVENENKNRCKCYSINNRGCTHKCKCINCGNPYGSSLLAKKTYTQSKVPRNRPKQKFQEARSNTTSLGFLTSIGFSPNTGWTDTENFFVDCLVNYALLKKLCIEPRMVHKYYSRACEISSNGQKNFCVTPKKLKQIEGKVLCIKKSAHEFQALYKKQVELNWFS